MKALVALIAVLVGSMASAKDLSNVSWSKILSNRSLYTVQNVKVDFQDQAVQVNIWSSDLCTDGEFIFGGTFQKKVWLDDENKKFKTVNVELVQPIVSEKAMVVPGVEDNTLTDPNSWYYVAYVQSPTVELAIFDSRKIDNDGKTNAHSLIGTKTYSIPRCALPPTVTN